jgi:hypothetical protein
LPGAAGLPLPRYHLLTSLALGGLLYRASGDRRRLLAPLATGFLIDVDHLFDYALARTGRGRRLVLPLHGWELVPLVALLDRALRTGGALAAGYALHLVLDQIWNEKRSRLAYFLTFRASRGFSAEQLGPLDPNRRHSWRRSSLRGLIRWF